MEGGEDGLGAWDGNVIKLGCDDHRTTRNIIKFIKLKEQTNKKECLEILCVL